MSEFDTKDFLDFEEKYTNMLSELGLKLESEDILLGKLHLHYVLKNEENEDIIEVFVERVGKDEHNKEEAFVLFHKIDIDNLYNVQPDKLVEILKPIIDKIRGE